MSKLQVFKQYPRIFWISNLIELFERYAWYGFYMGFGLFLVGSKETGAMGFSPEQKGIIMGTGSMLLYFLPIITGAIADRVGYKKVLFLAFLIYISGFFMIQNFESFNGFEKIGGACLGLFGCLADNLVQIMKPDKWDY